MRPYHASSSLIGSLGRTCTRKPCVSQIIHSAWAAVSELVRQASSSAGASASLDEHVVLAMLQEELAALSIPAGELTRLASSGLSDAALTAWALSKTSVHAAADKAAASSQRLHYLMVKLDGAMLRQQAAETSPVAELFWQVSLSAAHQQLRGMSQEQLEACVEYRAAIAALKSGTGSHQREAALTRLEQQLAHLVDTSPRTTLAHPAFWQLAQAAAGSNLGLAEDLVLLGYDLTAAAAVGQAQLQQVQQLLGLDAAQLQQQLVTQLQTSSNILLPDQRPQLQQAVSSSAPARALLGQLQLIEVLSACLGLPAVQLCSAPSSLEVVRRLTGRAGTPAATSQQLAATITAAAPALVSAVSQLSASSLVQQDVAGLLQLMRSKPELTALHQAVTAWRAEASAAGSLPVLSSLCQSEVSGLSAGQAEAVGRQVMQLEAQARLVMRQAAAGQLDLTGLGPEEADALAWRLHTGGAQAAEELVELILMQAASITCQHAADADAAEGALASLAAGFELEESTSRRSTAAPPSPYLMAGIPQMQLGELAQQAGPTAIGTAGSTATSNRSKGGSGSQLDTAERLVRDLALLLTSSSSSGVGAGEGLQAALQRLQYVAHDLPRVLSGPLLDLLAAFQGAEVAGAEALQQRQQQLKTFMHVVAAELPTQLQAGSAADGHDSSWASGGRIGSKAAAAGLLELLGEQDSGEVLRHAAEKGVDEDGGAGQSYDAGDDNGHLYGWLANIHHDQDMQRYLQIEFEPSLDVDVVHAPRGWRDPDLFTSAPDFMEAMRPLLDTYLAAQGERPLQDMEWQVYRDAALAEAEQVEAGAAALRHAAGHSPFNNSRADEAFLRERLEAGIPKDSVLYAAAHKYLTASFKNRSWRFAQRKRMVDVLVRIADHLAAHPPRSHRGSPFSALFQPDGPPIVPRISQQVQKGADTEAYALPPGFGAASAAPAQH